MYNSIQEDDYVITDSGTLGCKYHCKPIGEFTDWDSLITMLQAHMDTEQYWPNIWYINDHGNEQLIRI